MLKNTTECLNKEIERSRKLEERISDLNDDISRLDIAHTNNNKQLLARLVRSSEENKQLKTRLILLQVSLLILI